MKKKNKSFFKKIGEGHTYLGEGQQASYTYLGEVACCNPVSRGCRASSWHGKEHRCDPKE